VCPQKILIIRLSSIGDILLATPLIRALRSRFPEARLDFVVKANFAEVLRHHPALSNLFELNPKGGWQELKALGRRLRDARYDVVFDIHKNFRSRYLAHAARPKKILRYRKRVFRRWLLVQAKINLMRKAPPVYQRYLEAAAPLGVSLQPPLVNGRRLELFWSEKEEQEVEAALLARRWQPGLPLIGLAPGAGFFTKRWPPEYFGELAAALIRQGRQVVVLGGTPDAALAKVIEEKIAPEQGIHFLNLTGALSILGSAAVIKRCRLLVANDSGPMHVAEAVGTPLLAIFGSTTRELGFFPQLSSSRVVENFGLSCRPCSHLGHAQCPAGHFRCMREIAPSQIAAMINETPSIAIARTR
jgi:heptosyltransferase-2